MILRLFASILMLVCAVCAASASTVTVYAWPLSASAPQPFAEIAVTGEVAELKSKKSITVSNEELVRVGLLHPDKSWTGVATSAKSFAPGVSQKILLHTDTEGQVTHIGFSSFAQDQGDESSKELIVEVVPIRMGSQPVLNKPIVLNAEGKVDAPQEEQKSFLQKYWWAIALFFILQAVAGGGGKE